MQMMNLRLLHAVWPQQSSDDQLLMLSFRFTTLDDNTTLLLGDDHINKHESIAGCGEDPLDHENCNVKTITELLLELAVDDAHVPAAVLSHRLSGPLA